MITGIYPISPRHSLLYFIHKDNIFLFDFNQFTYPGERLQLFLQYFTATVNKTLINLNYINANVDYRINFIMSEHRILCYLFEALGYGRYPGICHGFTLRWIEAGLLGMEEEQRFERRIKRIVATYNENNYLSVMALVSAIRRAQAIPAENRSPDERDLVDILCFFDSLALFHFAKNHSEVFPQNSIYTQLQVDEVSAVASSRKIEESGGLKTLFSEAVIFTESEINQYLKHLKEFLDKSIPHSTAPIAFLLSTLHHSVGLMYQPHIGWTFRDINRPLDTSITQVMSTQTVARYLVEGCGSQSPYVAFNIKAILTGNDSRCALVQSKLRQFQAFYPVTQTLAQRQADTNLAYLAAVNGNIKVISQLNSLGFDLDNVTHQQPSLAYAAANLNQVELIYKLKELGADLNKGQISGSTPASIAADMGHLGMIRALLYLGADIEQPFTLIPEELIYYAKSLGSEVTSRALIFLANKTSPILITPYDIAKIRGHQSIVDYIDKYRETKMRTAETTLFTNPSNQVNNRFSFMSSQGVKRKNEEEEEHPTKRVRLLQSS